MMLISAFGKNSILCQQVSESVFREFGGAANCLALLRGLHLLPLSRLVVG